MSGVPSEGFPDSSVKRTAPAPFLNQRQTMHVCLCLDHLMIRFVKSFDIQQEFSGLHIIHILIIIVQ